MGAKFETIEIGARFETIEVGTNVWIKMDSGVVCKLHLALLCELNETVQLKSFKYKVIGIICFHYGVFLLLSRPIGYARHRYIELNDVNKSRTLLFLLTLLLLPLWHSNGMEHNIYIYLVQSNLTLVCDKRKWMILEWFDFRSMPKVCFNFDQSWWLSDGATSFIYLIEELNALKSTWNDSTEL